MVLPSTVAWHPFAVSFVAPGFHDWQRNQQPVLSLDAHRVDGLSDVDRVYGIRFHASRSERTRHTDAEHDPISITFSQNEGVASTHETGATSQTVCDRVR